MPLRDYQQDSVDRLRKSIMAGNRKNILQLPVGHFPGGYENVVYVEFRQHGVFSHVQQPIERIVSAIFFQLQCRGWTWPSCGEPRFFVPEKSGWRTGLEARFKIQTRTIWQSVRQTTGCAEQSNRDRGKASRRWSQGNHDPVPFNANYFQHFAAQAQEQEQQG